MPASAEAADQRSAARRRSSSAAQTAAVVGAALGLAFSLGALLHGYYDVSAWGPLGLGLLAVLMVGMLTGAAVPPLPALIPALGLTLLGAAQLLSATWAESADRAVIEGQRTLVYATAAVILAWVAQRRSGRIGLMAGLLTGGTLFLGVVVARMLAPGYAEAFLSGRLEEPMGYVNGMAAALVMTAWPFLGLAEGVRSRPLAGAAAGTGALAFLLAAFVQSRGATAAALVAAVAVLVLLPGRARRLALFTLVLAAVAAAWPAIADVASSRPAGGGPPAREAVREAVLRSLVLAAVVAVAWAVFRWLIDVAPVRRLAQRHAVRRAVTGIAVLAVIAGAVVALPPGLDRAERAWEQFTSLQPVQSQSQSQSRLAFGGGNRYDVWRIGLDQFTSQPLIGVGAGNYYATYFKERRSAEDVRQAHSIEVQVLGETGLTGAIGLLVFLAGAVVAGWRARPLARRPGYERGILVSSAAVALFWLVHTSVDWLHLLPSVTGLALAAVAMLTGLAAWPPPAVARRSPLIPIAFAAATLAAAGLGVTVLAQRETARARQLVAADPEAAIGHARRSLELNGGALDAFVVLAAAQAKLDQYEEARATLLAATRSEPSNFLPWALLGDLALRRGARDESNRYYRRALALNPKSAAIRSALDAGRGGNSSEG